MATIDRFLRDQRGTTAIEYGLIACLISIVIVASVRQLGGNLLNNYFNTIAAAVN